MLARDVLSSPVTTLPLDVPAHAAAGLLVSHGFTGAPVVAAEHRVVGIATDRLTERRIQAEMDRLRAAPRVDRPWQGRRHRGTVKV